MPIRNKVTTTLLVSVIIICCCASTVAQRVWANTDSHVYHCAGSPNFGKTHSGQYMSESKAVATGFRPAKGIPCGELSVASTALPITGVGTCGIKRWPVKILFDQDRSKVNFVPVDATVSQLISCLLYTSPSPR